MSDDETHFAYRENFINIVNVLQRKQTSRE